MSLSEFIQEVSKLPIKVGSINGAQQRFIQEFLNSHPEVRIILETGFHVGLSAAIMMEARPDISVTSFDIFWFDYTRKAKLLLDIAYPGRNTLVAGNSINTLPTFFTQNTYSPDLVFIDGGHEHPIPYIDLYYILRHVKPGTYIMIDDYCMEHGQQGVIGAVNRFIELGVIVDSQVYKAEDRGWVFGVRSSLPMPSSDVDISKEAIDKLLRDTESHYSEAQGVKKTMDFTFGIVTDGKDIQRIVDSIRKQNIPKYEIIVVGKTDVKGVIQIPFDETKPLTKKKNLIAQVAKYENIVFLHDYVELSPEWYEGFVKFGNSFEVCVNKILTIDGRRFRDHVLFKECIPKIETLLPYGCELTPAVSKLLYISGT
jgi:predicted O-methyltransferase YrrM